MTTWFTDWTFNHLPLNSMTTGSNPAYVTVCDALDAGSNVNLATRRDVKSLF